MCVGIPRFNKIVPPSTGMSTPVTYEDSSDSRNAITPACSLGWLSLRRCPPYACTLEPGQSEPLEPTHG